MKLEWSSAVTPNQKLIDAVMDVYVLWREQSAAVETSYRVWKCAPARERDLAYADYIDALDCEERLANEYQRLVEQAAGLSRS